MENFWIVAIAFWRRGWQGQWDISRPRQRSTQGSSVTATVGNAREAQRILSRAEEEGRAGPRPSVSARRPPSSTAGRTRCDRNPARPS